MVFKLSQTISLNTISCHYILSLKPKQTLHYFFLYNQYAQIITRLLKLKHIVFFILQNKTQDSKQKGIIRTDIKQLQVHKIMWSFLKLVCSKEDGEQKNSVKQIQEFIILEIIQNQSRENPRYKAISTETQQIVSLKQTGIICQRELQILEKCNHPNIIKIKQYFKINKKYFIVSQFCNGGTLYDYIVARQNNRLSELEAIYYLQQIVSALQEFHEKGFVITNLNVQNILLHNNCIKIGKIDEQDNSQKFQSIISIENSIQNSLLVSNASHFRLTRAPETLVHRNQQSYKSDLWSIAVIYYFMLMGKYPYNNEEEIARTMKVDGLQLNQDELCLSLASRDFLIRTLVDGIQPNKRIGWQQFLNHPIFNNFQPGILGTLNIYRGDITERIDITKGADFYQLNEGKLLDENEKSYNIAMTTILENESYFQRTNEFRGSVSQKISQQITEDTINMYRNYALELEESDRLLQKIQFRFVMERNHNVFLANIIESMVNLRKDYFFEESGFNLALSQYILIKMNNFMKRLDDQELTDLVLSKNQNFGKCQNLFFQSKEFVAFQQRINLQLQAIQMFYCQEEKEFYSKKDQDFVLPDTVQEIQSFIDDLILTVIDQLSHCQFEKSSEEEKEQQQEVFQKLTFQKLQYMEANILKMTSISNFQYKTSKINQFFQQISNSNDQINELRETFQRSMFLQYDLNSSSSVHTFELQ